MNIFTFTLSTLVGKFFTNKNYHWTHRISLSFARCHYLRIIDYCKNNNIFVTLSLNGANTTTRNRDSGVCYISLNSLEHPSLILATLIHEVGHVLDWRSEVVETKSNIASISYSTRHCLSSSDEYELYEMEQRAWDLGELFAKDQGIELGRWFYDVKNISLAGYKPSGI